MDTLKKKETSHLTSALASDCSFYADTAGSPKIEPSVTRSSGKLK